MADDASELDAGPKNNDNAAERSAEFVAKFKRAFEASKSELQSPVVSRVRQGTALLDQCVLGPHYIGGMPRIISEVLGNSLVDDSCLAHGADWSSWSGDSKASGAWPKLTAEWIKWLPRMEHFFGEKWKKDGIYDSIKMTVQEIHMDRPLLAAGLCFWSSATNTLNLPFGPMTITLLDMAVIFGFRPSGQGVCATSVFPSPFQSSLKPKVIEADKRSKDGKSSKNDKKAEKAKKAASVEARRLLNYNTFYTTHAVDEPVSETKRADLKPYEHAAFLLYWLCKFVFCTKSNKCTLEFAGVAESLSVGDPLALGQCVLSRLYRSLRNVVTDNMSLDHGGPIWMFQVWIQTYFQQLRPTCPPFLPNVILGRHIIPLGILSHSAADCFAFFFSKNDMSMNEFAVCYSRTNPSFLTVDISEPWDQMYTIETTLIWGSILIPRDLNYGLKGTQGRHGVEVYLPNFVARQLGFIQSCPALFLMSGNRFSSWRDGFTRAAECDSVGKYYEVQLGKLERSGLPFRSPLPIVTTQFRDWWPTFFERSFGRDLAAVQRIALEGFPNSLCSKECVVIKKATVNQIGKDKGSSKKKKGSESRKRSSTTSISRNIQTKKKTRKSTDEEEALASIADNTIAGEDITFETNIVDGQGALAVSVDVREANVTVTARNDDTSTNSLDSADRRTSESSVSSENENQERARLDRFLLPAENTYVEISTDDLGLTTLSDAADVGQPLPINTLGQKVPLCLSSTIREGESRSSTTLDLVDFNQTGVRPPIFGFITSPLNKKTPQQVDPVPTGLVDHTTDDLVMESLQFLDTFDDIASPTEEKLDTAETRYAFETVRQFLGCDVRVVVTEKDFLDFKRAIEVLTSANHIPQVNAIEINAYIAAVDFGLHPYLEALKEVEMGDTLVKDFEEVRHSTNFTQLHELKTSLALENQNVFELKKQLAEAEEKVKETTAAIRNIISPAKLGEYKSLATSVRSYTKKKEVLQRQIDQVMQNFEKIKGALRPLLPLES